MKKIYILLFLPIFFFGITLPSLASANWNDGGVDFNDDYLTAEEGTDIYGDLELTLTTDGDTDEDRAFTLDRAPEADGDGDLYYDREFDSDDDVTDQVEDGEALVVLFGIDANGNGEYDGPESDVDDDQSFEATLPTACGVLEDDGNGDYYAELDAVNGSDVDGNVWVHADDDDEEELEIEINAHNLSESLPHVAHIHAGGDSECPNSAGYGEGHYGDYDNNHDQNGNDWNNNDWNNDWENDWESENDSNWSDNNSKEEKLEELQERLRDLLEKLQNRLSDLIEHLNDELN